jgi:transposase InsO family protein
MTKEQAELIANFRYGVIAPLVVERLDRGEQARILRELAAKEYSVPFSKATRVHKRTLERWLRHYRRGGLEALKPTGRADRGNPRSLPRAALEKAVGLKRELSSRSVPQIISMLELMGEVDHGQLKPSTLRRHLSALGIRMPSRESSHRRFQSPHRNHTWQGDCHHTLYLPDPEDPGRKRQAYLIAFLDDYSRFVPHGEYYFEERRPKLEDALKKAVLKCGIPSRLYCDNGAIYSGQHLERIAGELGFHLIHSRPGKPQGRGKVEKFFQYVDRSFKPETYALIAAGKITTLEQLNEYFCAWLEVAYHRKVHGVLKQTPKDRFESDPTPLKRLDPFRVRQVFLWQEKRRVDKTGCFTLDGNTYEVSAALVRRTITVRYDPYDLSLIQVWVGNEQYPDAQPLDLQRTRRREVSQSTPILTTPSISISLLELAKRQYEEIKRQKLGEMRFPRVEEEKTQ